VQVLVRDNNVDQALRALKKKMQREGIFREMPSARLTRSHRRKGCGRRPRPSGGPARPPASSPNARGYSPCRSLGRVTTAAVGRGCLRRAPKGKREVISPVSNLG